MNILDSLLGLKRSVISDAPSDVEITLFGEQNEILLSTVLHNEHYSARKVEKFTVTIDCPFTPTEVRLLPSEEKVDASIDGNKVAFEIESLDIIAMYSIK